MKRWIFILSVMAPSFSYAVSQGPNSPGTSANDATVGTINWSNIGTPGNIASSDNIYSTAQPAVITETTKYLKASNFGFSISSAAVILGIEVTIEDKKVLNDGDIVHNAARMVKRGTIGSTDKTVTWGTSEAVYILGSPTDVWGDVWSGDDINNSASGFAVSATISGPTTPGIAYVDQITMTVYYLGGSSQTFTSSSTWIAPTGVTNVTAQVWGGGGGGNNTTGCGGGGGGGGGGAYSFLVATVTPGVTYTVNIGSAGIGADPTAFNGGDSWFISVSSILARGGKGGTAPTGGLGGASSGGVGSVKLSGGNGGNGDISGGGGGSSAGISLVGVNGSNGDGSGASGGAGGTAPAGGGNGASGGDDSTAPGDGISPGGGGGGRGCDVSGRGDGAVGKIILTWTESTPSTAHNGVETRGVYWGGVGTK